MDHAASTDVPNVDPGKNLDFLSAAKMLSTSTFTVPKQTSNLPSDKRRADASLVAQLCSTSSDNSDLSPKDKNLPAKSRAEVHLGKKKVKSNKSRRTL